MEEELKKGFGDKVSVSYTDLTGKDLTQYPEIKKLTTMGYPAPYVIIQGKPKFAGGVMADRIKEAINSLLKAK
ncbi:MAG: hypothetical protein HPY81_09005 [Firmicutes bacterium]|nr:hypothetical protein [Bacillota bacterium]